MEFLKNIIAGGIEYITSLCYYTTCRDIPPALLARAFGQSSRTGSGNAEGIWETISGGGMVILTFPDNFKPNIHKIDVKIKKNISLTIDLIKHP